MIQDQFYPYDTQALVAWPTNLSGIVTLTDVRALKLHYVYTNTQPVSPGTTDLVLDRPTSRHTLRQTTLVAQWTEHRNPAPGAEVRLLPRACTADATDPLRVRAALGGGDARGQVQARP